MTKRILLLSTLLVAIAEQASLFAQALHVGATLSNYHGVQVSCAHLGDGSITLSVTGGTAPYVYLWNTGATTQNLTGLASGTYSVVVKDSATPQHNAGGSWILHEPGPIDPSATPYEYPNGFNVSCFACYNGSIAVTVGGGTAPFTYSWNDGATTEDRSSLGMGNYQLTVTDVNGCTGTSSSVYLDEPERADWTMTGNTGSNPPTQFIGTSDSKDLVFKTNGTERLTLTSSGGLKVNDVAPSAGYALLMADSTGRILKMTNTFSKPCPSPLPWLLCGNTIQTGQYIGTNNHRDLIFKTDGSEAMRIDADGKVGIGVVPPNPSTSLYMLYVDEGIATRDVKVTISAFPDYVFEPDYSLMPMTDLRGYLAAHKHLPGMPSAKEVATNEGAEIGDLQSRMLKNVEEQALYILQLKAEIDSLRARLDEMEHKQ